MGLILWVLFGAVAGWLGSMIMGSKNGFLLNIVLGIVGAVAGGFIMSALGQPGITGINVYSLLIAILGAVVVLGLARMFKGGR